MSRTTLFLVLGYAAVLAASLGAVVEAQRRLSASLATPEARAEWDAWRAETVKQSGTSGPVARRPAKAAEPPMLILLRDHYSTALVSTGVAATLFYWLLAVLVRGSWNTPAPAPADEAEPTR